MTFEEAEEFFYAGTSYIRHTVSPADTGRNCTFEMNGLMELLRSQRRRIGELEAEAERFAHNAERKAAAILEGERRQFHHEVLRSVLSEYIRASLASTEAIPPLQLPDVFRTLVSNARFVADLAYPPPKAEP